MFSESEKGVKGHGVHTAYLELVNALRARNDVAVDIDDASGADIVHLHTVGPRALRHLLLSPGKKVVSAHVVPASFVGSLAGAKYWLWLSKIYLRWFYSRADLVLSVSDETTTELKELGVRAPIELFYNVIDTSRYCRTLLQKTEIRKKLGFSDEEWIVIGSGQVQPRKRIDTMIELARALPDVRFVWVGGIPFKAAAADYPAMKRIMEHAPANMTFTGLMTLENVQQYYKAADVFILPSDQETFGLVVVEAAAAGLPIILRDIPDYNHTFRDVALMRDDTTFGKTIEKLRDNKDFYAEAVKQSAVLAERYDSKQGAERLMALYHKLVLA